MKKINVKYSRAERFRFLSAEARTSILEAMSEAEAEALLYDWWFWARPNQLPPKGNWFCWCVMAGRGFGKTRMGVEWVRSLVEGPTPLTAPKNSPRRIALVAQTSSDGREVMIEGDSGFLRNSPPDFRPKFEASRKRLIWPNGVEAFLYSGDEPDQLRGPQHGAAWADELAKWNKSDVAWSNLMFGLRVGANPRVMVTTTPRPLKLLKEILEDEKTVVTRGTTYENRSNLSPRFLEEMERLYDGTRLGRQELYGHLLEDTPGALWSLEMIEHGRVRDVPELIRIVVALDPPVSHGEAADACGIVVAGVDAQGELYVLADRTVQGLRPHAWAEKALGIMEEFAADRIVAEVNNGGDLVEDLMRQIAPHVSYRALRASRGKIARAEPVAALYERGMVHHVGEFRELEGQMIHYTGGKGEASPDRMDALVWAITELALSGKMEPRIRKI